MSRTIIIAGVIIVIIVAGIWIFTTTRSDQADMIRVPVKHGRFIIDVTTTGELEAKSSENIYGPQNLRSVQIWSDIKINRLIPEGTIVDSGDFVASLDQTEIMSRLKDLENELEKLQSQYTRTMLDTSLNLRSARNDLFNLQFALEEQQLRVDQSKFEPPAVQRQEAINLEKARRAYEQAMENYQLRLEKARAEMQEVTATLEQARRRRERLLDILNQFTVYAPKKGMIIYRRDWRGRKIETGSTISSWDNVVALLPDLSQMISRTYVNEIDISRVRVGQSVKITVDAFPDREYTGVVAEVANIGEQRPGSDAKVFEVIIHLNESDTTLRPAMTTKNMIITEQFDEVLFIPIEALHGNDTISYVYKEYGMRIVKKQVKPGLANHSEIIILEGLKPGDEVFLTIPKNHADLRIVPLHE